MKNPPTLIYLSTLLLFASLIATKSLASVVNEDSSIIFQKPKEKLEKIEEPGTLIVRSWCSPEGWPNNVLPTDGEDVLIPENHRVILGCNTASLGNLQIEGELVFEDKSAGETIQLTAKQIWVRGKLEVKLKDYGNEAVIKLTGTLEDQPFVGNFKSNPGTSVLLVTGQAVLVGQTEKLSGAHLVRKTKQGALVIQVDYPKNFAVGDQIVIAPTDFAENEWEVRMIRDISSDGITLDRPIDYFHYGADHSEKLTHRADFDFRGEVYKLNRGLRIEGVEGSSVGAKILVTQEKVEDTVRTGNLLMKYASLAFCGDANNERAGLNFEYVYKEKNLVFGNVIRDCVGYGIKSHTSSFIRFDTNTLLNISHVGLLFRGEHLNVNAEKNRVIGIPTNPLKKTISVGLLAEEIPPIDAPGIRNLFFSHNIISGCSNYCYKIPSEGVHYFYYNIAHSARVGVAIQDYCPFSWIGENYAYKTDKALIFTTPVTRMTIENWIFIDNIHSIILPELNSQSSSIQVFGCSFFGVKTPSCPECYQSITSSPKPQRIAAFVYPASDRISSEQDMYRLFGHNYAIHKNHFFNYDQNPYPSIKASKFAFTDRDSRNIYAVGDDGKCNQ